jgi:hypothetical protein
MKLFNMICSGGAVAMIYNAFVKIGQYAAAAAAARMGLTKTKRSRVQLPNEVNAELC